MIQGVIQNTKIESKKLDVKHLNTTYCHQWIMMKIKNPPTTQFLLVKLLFRPSVLDTHDRGGRGIDYKKYLFVLYLCISLG